jgi:hypothetical protein
MRGCISERRRIESDGKRKKFSEANGNCTWRLNKFQWKRHLLQLFVKYYLKKVLKNALLFAYCVLKRMDF